MTAENSCFRLRICAAALKRNAARFFGSTFFHDSNACTAAAIAFSARAASAFWKVPTTSLGLDGLNDFSLFSVRISSPPRTIGYSFKNSDRTKARAFSMAFRSAGFEKSVSGSFLNFAIAIHYLINILISRHLLRATTICDVPAGTIRHHAGCVDAVKTGPVLYG